MRQSAVSVHVIWGQKEEKEGLGGEGGDASVPMARSRHLGNIMPVT